ncbi:MAG TPA: alpha/beta fold hydrolase [Pyrinomonadaceae bacterium]
MYPAGNLFIPTSHGRLEAILKEPRAHGEHASPRGAALVLHPHPLHGGTMHNKVVFRAARALNDAGLVTLRINFRGVGHSTGTHDEARGEQDDARDALDYLAAKYEGLPLTLAGFSFGARVGLEYGATEPRISHLIGIGTPVNMYDFAFLQNIRRPLLLVHGEQDEFGDIARLQSLSQQISTHHTRVQLAIIPNAGHFFEGQLDEMSSTIREWMEKQE